MQNKLMVFIFLFGLLQGAVIAQTGEEKIDRMREYYEAFKFKEVISTGHALLNNTTNLIEDELILIHEYMAISFYTLGEADSAHQHFTILLAIDKNYEPDPIRTSPKIRDFFQTIKEDFHYLDDQGRLKYVKRYMFIEDLRPGAAWRSALLPGWGQFYKEQPVKGYIFGSSILAGVMVTAGAWIKEYDYKDQYLSSNNPSEITDLYDKYNQWSKFRRGAMYTTIAIWVLNFSDALWSDYPRIQIEHEEADTIGLSVILSF